LGHFPSHGDLKEMGRYDLSNQITRRGGFLKWSDRLGIERRTSDSDTGWEGERAASERLQALGFRVTPRRGVKCPFDLLIDGVLRIDVKAARQQCYGDSRGWFYRIGKLPQADLVLLWQLDTGGFYAVPWFLCPTTNITISPTGGKYARFRNNAGLIRDMLALRQQERRRLWK
jgi:hypothetical protein